MISIFFFQNLVAALGSAVIHSTWQIAVVWLVFQTVRPAVRSPRAAYFLALGAMLGSVVWAFSTFSSELFERSESGFFDPISKAAAVGFFEKEAQIASFSIEKGSEKPFFEKAASLLERHSALVGWAWVVVFSIFWVRILGGFWLSQKMRNAPAEPLAPELFDLFERLKTRLGVSKKARLLVQKGLVEPVALGFFRPVVLFPAACLTQLSTAQVEALLLHELAHLRRHDYFFNLVQIALESVFFYHPLFWSLSKTARAEREICCDDLVLDQKADRLAYARALTDLQLLPIFQQNRLAMTAISNGEFGQRIARIMGARVEKSSRQPLVFFGFLMVVVAAFGCSLSTKKAILQQGSIEKAAIENPKDSIRSTRCFVGPKPNAVSVQDFQKKNGIEAELPDFLIEAKAEIVSYQMAILIKGEDPVEFPVNGPEFPLFAKKMLEKLTPGSRVFFDEIRCRVGSEKGTRELAPLVFKITD